MFRMEVPDRKKPYWWKKKGMGGCESQEASGGLVGGVEKKNGEIPADRNLLEMVKRKRGERGGDKNEGNKRSVSEGGMRYRCWSPCR